MQFLSSQGLIHELEELYASCFCGGDLRAARGKLKSSQARDTRFAAGISFGLRAGAILVLLVWFVWDCAVGDLGKDRRNVMVRSSEPPKPFETS